MRETYQATEALTALAQSRRTIREHLPDPTERKSIRIRAGLSQADIARALDVSRQSIARWETGERHPSNENVARYVAVLRRLAADLEQEDGEEWPNDS